MRVVFNADDFGSHPRISRGIIKAMQQGVVRSTTVLANMVTDEELSWLAKMPDISVGAHLNLTKGTPVTPFPRDFLDEHGGFSKKLVFSPAGGPVLPAGAVREELGAQIGRLEENGLSPDHLDSHHHIHGFASVLDVVVRLARERGLAVRAISPWMSDFLAAAGVPRPDRFIDSFFGKNNISQERLENMLRDALKSGVSTAEVMCHPGYSEGLPEGHTMYRKERELELETLSSPELMKWLKDEGIEVTRYEV